MDLNILIISLCVILYCMPVTKCLMVIVALERSKFEVDISFPVFFSSLFNKDVGDFIKDRLNSMCRRIAIFTDTAMCTAGYAC